ncbi:MAG: hypothetical protein WCO33_00080 [bacterium]
MAGDTESSRAIQEKYEGKTSGIRIVTLALTGEVAFGRYTDSMYPATINDHIVRVMPSREIVKDLPDKCAIKNGMPRDELRALYGTTAVLSDKGKIELRDLILTSKCINQCIAEVAIGCEQFGNAVDYMRPEGDTAFKDMIEYLSEETK